MLFRQWGEGLRNFMLYKTGDISQAEDLSQEAWLRLWRACAKVSPAKAKSFLFTTANRLFLDDVKHQKVVLKFSRQQLARDRTNEDPEFQLEEAEFYERLQHAISSLPEKNRTVFLMNRIDKLTYREIAERLDISQKAVEKRMSKALTKLRKLTQKI
ncbi:MAG: sigma-70 family RNA polymerase sigma factor [Bacteroidota bacterium]